MNRQRSGHHLNCAVDMPEIDASGSTHFQVLLIEVNVRIESSFTGVGVLLDNYVSTGIPSESRTLGNCGGHSGGLNCDISCVDDPSFGVDAHPFAKCVLAAPTTPRSSYADLISAPISPTGGSANRPNAPKSVWSPT